MKRRPWRQRLARTSIRARLLIASLLLVMVALPLAGTGLAYNFRDSVTTAFDDRLESLLNVLLAGVQIDAQNEELHMTRSLGDPRFERVFSGWYWQVSDDDGQTLTSRSLWDQRLPIDNATGVAVSEVEGPRGDILRVIERDIRLPGHAETLHVSVAASRAELDTEVARFEWLLGLSLLALGALLLVGLAVQIRWGLAPLRRMHTNLRAVESGDADSLETQFLPDELARLARAMNGVLERDKRLIERGRNAAGNLAHALKTPVSVLTTLAERFPPDTRDRLHGELGRIDDAVRHHLARASAAGGVVLAGKVDVAQTLAPVLEGLTRMGQRRGVQLTQSLADDLKVRMEAQDLQELVGNLLENALRWADSQVTVSFHPQAAGVELLIEDDGPGMSEEQRDAALARGSRLDERRSGSGLGLAIVEDLMTLYGGRLSLSRASLGGLAARVWLPASPVAPSGIES
ncbi:Signal transduction histidine kinase [Chromohalobacter canadensis]|uniref:histidine kinase n=1 Tax=Chromohalobacter canadensis TaxID=141389 RepID=A0A285VRH3_9GAMM|nr:sensor histidine kinase [Chromohalobacter canadensis]SOC56684.1 Signal transduction histidine kinase [Chromohalobacter canadensis]